MSADRDIVRDAISFWDVCAHEALDRLAAAEAQRDTLAEALASAENQHAALLLAIDDGDDNGEHVGLQRHRRAVYEGQAEILSRWNAALAAAAPTEAKP